MHFSLAWLTSKFENDTEAIDWQNGYWGDGLDRTYLPPDNRYQRLAANATFRKLPLNSTVALRYTSDELKSSNTFATQVLNGTTGQLGTTEKTEPSRATTARSENDTLLAGPSPRTPMKGLDTRLYYNKNKRDDKSTHPSPSIAHGGLERRQPYENEPCTRTTRATGASMRSIASTRRTASAAATTTSTRNSPASTSTRRRTKKWFAEWKNTSFDTLNDAPEVHGPVPGRQLPARQRRRELERRGSTGTASSGPSTSRISTRPAGSSRWTGRRSSSSTFPSKGRGRKTTIAGRCSAA